MRAVISLLFILLLNIVVFSQDISLSANSAEKYNKRGFFKNENLTLNGNEIISDYDGNLMVNYSTKVNLPADQSGDFTITYNANVDHRFFDDLETPTQGHMVNSPEWILGFRGFALQTLNFETNFFATHPDITNTSYQGEDIPLLIPGYHYNNALVPLPNDNGYDYFNILRADGSKIVLQNVKDHAKVGLYKEMGFEAKGFATVEYYSNPDDYGCSNYRKIWYKPGDGFTYVFEEKRVNYYGYDNSTCTDQAPRVLYLTQIMSPSSWKYYYYVQFNYSNSIPNASIDYGRKVFKSLEVLYYDPKNYKGTTTPELEVTYGYNRTSLLNIGINNYNINKNLTLNLSAPRGSSIGLFETGRDTSSIRKLNVTSVIDDLGRTDNFSYYNWTQGICNRTYINNSKFYNYKFPLLNSINYYTGKSSVFNYYDNLYTGYEQYCALDFGASGYMAANRENAYRDCFANFMLKSHELWNKYGATNTLSKTETYTYTFDRNYVQKLSVNGIKTKIEEYEGSSEIINRTRTTVKNYSNFRTNKPALNASDYEHTIKLMSENVAEENGPEVIEKYYTYDIGNPDGSKDPCYTGTMDLWKVKEIRKDVYTSKSTERIDSTAYTYENSHISYNGNSIIRPIKKTETNIDPNQLIHFTEYLNLFPLDTLFYTDNNSLYSIGLPREEKIIRSGVVSSDIVKEYYERGDLGNKLKKVTNMTNPYRQSYNIYTYSTGPSYMSLLSSIENDKGARQEFYYPNTSTFQEAIPGIIVKYDQSRVQSNFYHCGYQMQPFKTLTISTNPSGTRDTLINYSSYNPDGTLEFSVDENGLHSAFAYDKVGRLISAALPGSFIDGTTAFVPHSDYFMDENFVYYESKSNTGTTKSYIKGAPYNISSSNFERGGSSTNMVYNSYMYHCFLSSAISASSGIQKAILRLRIQCIDNIYGYPSEIVIGGIKGGYDYRNNFNSYATYSSVYATVPETNGNYIDLEVDVTSLINALGTSEALYGFRIEPSSPANDLDPNTSIEFAIETAPVLTKYLIATGAVAGNPINKQPNITGTIVYSYDDVNNIVTEKRRATSDPIQANIKEVISKEVLDGMGLSRENSVINDGGAYEVKGTDTYNGEGKVLTHTDGLGRTVTSSYDFLQRLKTQTNGDDSAKNIYYTIQPNTISNGSYSVSYSDYTRIVDESSKEVYTYYDKIGNKVAEKVGTNPPTIFRYDSFYRIDSVISPEQKVRTYSYDELGNLKQKDAPADEGTTLYKYDKYKRLRFTMNSAALPYERGITFTKYDQFGRVLVTGTLSSTFGWSSLDADRDYSVNQNLPHFENYAYNAQTSTQPDTANFVCVNMYDKYTKSGIFAGMNDPFWWSPNDANSSRNLKGKLVLTAFRDKPGQGWNYRIYLYDALGKANYIYQKIGTAPWKYIFKETDVLGNQKRELLFKISGGSSVYEHAIWNNYDKEGRLIELRSDPAGNYSTSKQEASYSYNKADQCSTLTYNQVANANQTTTYSYSNTRGWLSTIQNGSNNFTESLGYYYNGNIQTQTITNSVLGGTKTLTYGYDAMNRLTSVMNGTSTVESFGYYADGNFSQRNYLSGGTLYGDGYEYDGNRLSILYSHIDEFAYSYDYKGNVSYDPYTGITNFTYDHRNLPLSITNSTGTVYRYRYDDGGNRIYKDAQGKKEYYFRDDLGHELAVFDISTDKLKTVNLYGNDIIGRIERTWESEYDPVWDEWTEYSYDNRFYYVKDHLGSIRQTLNTSGVVMSAMDYYAFGGTLSSYVQGSTVDKYKFTGKERDSETGLDYFGARYYDSKICRWMSVDPLVEKFPGWSPYNYCLNNPLKLTDPDGEGPWDIVKGFADAVTQDIAGRDYENTSDVDDKNDYSDGRIAGHIFSGIFGAVETAVGSLGAAGGGLLTVTSAGTTSPVSVPVALGGVALAGHGAVTMNNASNNLMNEKKGAGDSKKSGTEKIEKTRKAPGRDGGISKMIEEKKDGKTISVTHNVTNNGQTIHQHQTHVGKYGSTRRFPENWIENKTIGSN